jgi:alanine dehydrogenase
MEIGILREIRADENRLPLTPIGVSELVHHGAKVCLETKAGDKCGYSDADFEHAGAKICYSNDEVIGRSQLILKIGSPTAEEAQKLQPDQVVGCFWQLVLQKKETIELLKQKKITALGFEIIESEAGDLPVLHTMSELAGSIVAPIAQYLLQNHEGGRGILLGGHPGIPPAVILIIGAGSLGSTAARIFAHLGAQVLVLDKSPEKLRPLHRECYGRIATSISSKRNIEKGLAFANVVLGAVAVPGHKTPILITRDMLKLMRPQGLFMDFSIDLGGMSETSRPTTFSNPTYVDQGIIHYCVPNIPSNVARTSTQALNNSLLPYILMLGEKGYNKAMVDCAEIRNGTYMHMGNFLKPWLKEYFQ